MSAAKPIPDGAPVERSLTQSELARAIVRGRVLRVEFVPGNRASVYLSNDDTYAVLRSEAKIAVDAMDNGDAVEINGGLRVVPKILARSKISHVRTDTCQVWLHGCDPSWVVSNIRFAASAYVAEAEVVVVAEGAAIMVRGV